MIPRTLAINVGAGERFGVVGVTSLIISRYMIEAGGSEQVKSYQQNYASRIRSLRRKKTENKARALEYYLLTVDGSASTAWVVSLWVGSTLVEEDPSVYMMWMDQPWTCMARTMLHQK